MTDRVHAFENGDLRFEVTDSGPIDGERVVLLHGFPQTARIWDAVCAGLEERGYRTLRFDQRGYTERARPQGVKAYQLRELVRDVRALVNAAGGVPVHLVGHDWGAAVAWGMAGEFPSLVRTLTAVSVPHPAAFLRSMFTSIQLLRSYYIGAFQIPGLVEQMSTHFPKVLEALLRFNGMSDEQIQRTQVDIIESGSLTSAVNWYRALPFGSPSYLRKVSVPTTYVWSKGDVALGRHCADLCGKHVTGPYKFEALDGTHWIPEEQPDRLTAIIAERAASAVS